MSEKYGNREGFRMPINKRNLAVSIILTIVTCGIYGIYWFIVMTDDTKNVSGDINGASGGVAFLLTLVTCNIYGYYWAYKQGERIDNAKNARGIPSSNSNVLYLILAIFLRAHISNARISSNATQTLPHKPIMLFILFSIIFPTSCT
mgnify:CR=1 FL=1